MGKDTVFWMTKDRISEEWKIALPCQNDGDLIFSILKYKVCRRSYISSFFELRQKECSYQTLCIINNMKFTHQIYVYWSMTLKEVDWTLNL